MGKTRRDREEAAQRLIPRATTVLGLARRTARVPEGRFAWWQHAPATWDPILPRAEVTRTRRRRMLRQTSLGSTRRRYAGDKLRWGYFGPPSTIGLSSETQGCGAHVTTRAHRLPRGRGFGARCVGFGMLPPGTRRARKPCEPQGRPPTPGVGPLDLWRAPFGPGAANAIAAFCCPGEKSPRARNWFWEFWSRKIPGEFSKRKFSKRSFRKQK